jgi:hypothetical protein
LRYTFDVAGVPVYTLGQKMKVGDAPTEAVKRPTFVSKKPRFLAAKLGDGADTTFTFALDESESGAGYDLLYADGNHNNDLTDEKPLRVTRWSGGTKGFKPVRVLIEVGGSRVQYHVAVVAYDYQNPPTYFLQSWGYYSGEARFVGNGRRAVPRGNGRHIVPRGNGTASVPYAVALVDYNANGLFNDVFKDYAEGKTGDVLLVDVNRDGKFEQNEFASSEFRHCAKCVQVDGRYYELNVRPDGTGFTATPAQPQLATLQSGYDKFALVLSSENGMLSLRSDNGAARIPVGEYRIYGWQVEQRDKDGNVWLAQGNRYRNGGDAPVLSVKDTERHGVRSLRLASPLVAKLSVRANGGRDFDFSLNFTTASGEVINNVSSNGQPMPEPRLKIVDAKGKEITTLPFHYG